MDKTAKTLTLQQRVSLLEEQQKLFLEQFMKFNNIVKDLAEALLIIEKEKTTCQQNTKLKQDE
jgi:hypothetical protein